MNITAVSVQTPKKLLAEFKKGNRPEYNHKNDIWSSKEKSPDTSVPSYNPLNTGGNYECQFTEIYPG